MLRAVGGAERVCALLSYGLADSVGCKGLDHYQVRARRAWYAHITLSMLPLAYLAVTRAREQQRDRELDDASTSERGTDASGERLIPLSANEIRRPIAKLVLAPPSPALNESCTGPAGVGDANTRLGPVTNADAATPYRHEPSAVAALVDEITP